MLMKVLHSAAG